MNKTNVRAYAPTDVASTADLMAHLGYPTSREEMAERMTRIGAREDFATFVAEVAGEVVGMVGAAIMPSYVRSAPNGQIMALVVAPSFRGRGAGALLMAQAEAWLAGKNVARVVVTSRHHRREARAFYERLGYRETGTRFVKALRDGADTALQ